MKKHLLSIFASVLVIGSYAQCNDTPHAGTYIMSPSTVGTNYTLNGTTTYPTQKAFYICQGTTVTIQNRAGMDTFYVSPGGALIGFEANAFTVYIKNGASYNATNSATAAPWQELGSTLLNYTGPPYPPCSVMTLNMSQIGPNACTTTDVVEQSNWKGNVLLFPNPAENEIGVNSYVGSADLTITIYDVIGNVLIEKADLPNQTKLDISSLAKGIYFLRVMNGNEIVGTEKFVKN